MPQFIAFYECKFFQYGDFLRSQKIINSECFFLALLAILVGINIRIYTIGSTLVRPGEQFCKY